MKAEKLNHLGQPVKEIDNIIALNKKYQELIIMSETLTDWWLNCGEDELESDIKELREKVDFIISNVLIESKKLAKQIKLIP